MNDEKEHPGRPPIVQKWIDSWGVLDEDEVVVCKHILQVERERDELRYFLDYRKTQLEKENTELKAREVELVAFACKKTMLEVVKPGILLSFTETFEHMAKRIIAEFEERE